MTLTPPAGHDRETVVAFAGMTHLGLVSATSIAAKGFKTICYDGDAAQIERLNSGDLPVLEPDLDDLVAENGELQVFTSDLSDLAQCDMVYIAPDIPTDDEGRSDTAVIHSLIDHRLRFFLDNSLYIDRFYRFVAELDL